MRFNTIEYVQYDSLIKIFDRYNKTINHMIFINDVHDCQICMDRLSGYKHRLLNCGHF